METKVNAGTAFAVFGPPGAPVVVLVHGLGLSRQVWRWLVPVLALRFRVVAYDLTGHGESAAPDRPPVLRDLSRQLCDLMDHLEIPRAAIVGFSMGGMVARRFAQDHPDRVSALVLLHTAHRRSAQAQAAVEARAGLALSDGPAGTVGPALQRWFTEAFSALRPDIMDLARSWVLANDPAVYPLMYRILADGVAELIAPRPSLTCPALVLTGQDDAGNSPQMARAIAAEIPGARLVILPRMRHMALAEQPDAVNRPVLNFLQAALL